MRVRGLKRGNNDETIPEYQSHPMRVRGLKQRIPAELCASVVSHPMRVRGLKLVYGVDAMHWY